MNTNPDVDAWFDAYDNPQKANVQRVRELVLSTDARITECIKWKSPTFVFAGNIASFNPRSRKHVSLMFHTGARIPGEFVGLEGGGDTSRYMKFDDAEDVEAKADALQAVVRAWCAWKES